MGSHEWVDHLEKTNLGPTPGRWRVLIGRSAAIVLILGALSWISVSLIFNPLPRAPTGGESIPLDVAESPISSAAAPEQAEQPSPGPQENALDATASATAPAGAGAGISAVVHVIGAVKNPGVYTLPLGSRVLDAVQSAGGLAKDAAPENINLAAEVRDGEQISIPRRGDGQQNSPTGQGAESNTGTGSAEAGAQPGRLNVNAADAAQLEELPGIGPALAKRIVDFRAANGPFKNLGELDAVSGIGPALLAGFRDVVVFE